MSTPQEILTFWLEDVGPSGWYTADDPALDAKARDRFQADYRTAAEGGHTMWLTDSHSTLAYIVLTDQLPRNMYRGQAEAFALDPSALAASKLAIAKGWDKRTDEPGRQFFYLPLMHSENLCDQDRCVRLMADRLPETGAENLLHAKAHREVIRRFGRFPFRNAALDRRSTEAERAFLDGGGYGTVVRETREAA